jgi:dTDP-4-dehydrorhamnose reductase
VEILGEKSEYEIIALQHEDADCTDLPAVRNVILKSRPDIVINCAAYVRVDDCEDCPEDAFRINALGAFHVARASAELGASCVYISTDYVFDGRKDGPYLEFDAPNPINVYGTSKLAGEYLVRQASARHLIVRVASLFGNTGARGKGGNFVEAVLKKANSGEPLKVINDIRVSPTYTRDAAIGLAVLLQTGAEGIVHLTNQDDCSWYEFAKEALRLAGHQVNLFAISREEYRSRAQRPANSALLASRPIVKLRPWREALKEYLTHRTPTVRR